MKNIALLVFLSYSILIPAQTNIQEEINTRLVDLHQVGDNNENFEGYDRIKDAIGDAQIVMLGEQSHTDATTFESKIKLIKYLHQEMDFDILAFESNIYECDKAWSLIQEGQPIKETMAKAIFGIWSTLEELDPLYQYFEHQITNENPLILTGFDTQFYGQLGTKYFQEDLKLYLSNFESSENLDDEIAQLQHFLNTYGRKVKKKVALKNIATIKKLMAIMQDGKTDATNSWMQKLKSLEIWIHDTAFKTENRDQQMAENLIALKKRHPGKKIICWGATSHFLYNSSLIQLESKVLQKLVGDHYHKVSMMGDYVKDEFGDDLYTIGFITHEGTYGHNKTKTIGLPTTNSVEYVIGQSPNDNYFLPLQDLSLEGYLSRPLAHVNMTTDIANVMDGVIFNRYMRRPETDWVFHFQINTKKYLNEKKKQRFIEYSKQRKQNELDKKNKEAQEKARA